MSVIRKYRERVSKYGRKYVWDVIKRNKIYIPMNNLFFNLGGKVFRRNKLKDIIIIESHNDFDCNGGEIYNCLIKNKINEKYKIIWLIKNEPPKELPDNVKTFNIWKPSVSKTYYFCMAKYLFFDDVIIEKRRKEQVAIYCSHGACTIKNVNGKIVIPKTIDYVLSPGENFDQILSENFSVEYPSKRMLHTGFPSNDLLFQRNGDVEKITSGRFKNVILWMPTFRRGGNSFERTDGVGNQPLGIPIIKNKKELLDLNNYLAKYEALLIIKIHPMQDPLTYKEIKNKSFTNIKVLDGKEIKILNLDNYRLMSGVDALISDYSSSTYSYLLLNRPIGFAIDDIKEYNIGFIVSDVSRYMPGPKIENFNDLTGFISNVCENIDAYGAERMKLRSWMYEYVDGNSTQRLLSALGIL